MSISLAPLYAHLLERGDVSVDALLTYLAFRGHTALVPLIVNALERSREHTREQVVIAGENDRAPALAALARLGGNAHTAAVSVDPRLVSGFSVRVNNRFIDASARMKLVRLYHNALHAHTA